jgi:hypothetical protein
MTKKCAIHLKSGTILNTTYNQTDADYIASAFHSGPIGDCYYFNALLRWQDIAAIEWID